jgi:Ser/Thr protein kinase RdoA (MazF antagonist)
MTHSQPNEEPERLRGALPAWGPFKELALLPGNRNTVLLIERGSERFVAKTTRRTLPALEWLQQVLAKAHAAGFVVPRMAPTLDGALAASGVTVETWIDGSPLPQSELPRVLPLIREFHRLTHGFPQRPGFASSRELLSVDRGGDVDLSGMPEHQVSLCRAAWRQIPSDDSCVVHGDLNAENLLLTSQGAIGLIDWDESRVDLPLFDEVALRAASDQDDQGAWRAGARALHAWEVAVCWHVEPEHARRLAKGLRPSDADCDTRE